MKSTKTHSICPHQSYITSNNIYIYPTHAIRGCVQKKAAYSTFTQPHTHTHCIFVTHFHTQYSTYMRKKNPLYASASSDLMLMCDLYWGASSKCNRYMCLRTTNQCAAAFSPILCTKYFAPRRTQHNIFMYMLFMRCGWPSCSWTEPRLRRSSRFAQARHFTI